MNPIHVHQNAVQHNFSNPVAVGNTNNNHIFNNTSVATYSINNNSNNNNGFSSGNATNVATCNVNGNSGEGNNNFNGKLDMVNILNCYLGFESGVSIKVQVVHKCWHLAM